MPSHEDQFKDGRFGLKINQNVLLSKYPKTVILILTQPEVRKVTCFFVLNIDGDIKAKLRVAALNKINN